MKEPRGEKALTANLTELAQMVIDLGLLEEADRLRQVIGPVVEVLDGRPDRLFQLSA